MTDDAIDLAMDEIRAVTAFAVACAGPALAVFEASLPDDARPRAALAAALEFAAGAERTKALRDSAWAAQQSAHAARDAGHAAAAEAARAAMAVAGAAFLHPLAKATQVKHILGAGAHAARAFEMAADDERIGFAHVVRARALASSTVVAVLRRYPAAPAGGGRVGELTRQLDTVLRRPAAPARPRLVDAEAVGGALQALVGLPAWSSGIGDGGFLTMDLGGRAISATGEVHGEFRLDVPGGAWMVRDGDRVLATSDDERPVAGAAAEALRGRRITAIAVSVDGLALRIGFEGSTTLTIVPWSELDLRRERWTLSLPDGFVLTAGPGPLLRLVGANDVDPAGPDDED